LRAALRSAAGGASPLGSVTACVAIGGKYA
jgi:hypothetical protein